MQIKCYHVVLVQLLRRKSVLFDLVASVRRRIDGDPPRLQASSMLFHRFIRLTWLAAAVLFAAVHPRASVAASFRCVSDDGRVVYQDSSCPPGARGTLLDDKPNSGIRFAREKEIRRLNRATARDAAQRSPQPRVKKSKTQPGTNAAERRFVSTGMYVSEVRRKIGPPDQVVRLSVTGGGKKLKKDSRQRWVYGPADADPQTTTILTIKDGRVLHVERNVTY